MRQELGFAEVERWTEYFRALGVSHLYLSPILQATKGSTHGYDVVDHGRVSQALGGEEALAHLAEKVHRAGMGLIVDIVPNHMAVGPENPWWWDVLENGPAGLHASYFDMEWLSSEERMRDKVLLPVLGDHAGKVIEAGEIVLKREGKAFVLTYHEHRFPVAPRSLAVLVRPAADELLSPDLAFIADAYENLPLPTATDRASVERRHRDKSVLGGQLARLAEERPEVARALDAAVAKLNADPEALDAFLSQQNHRLAYWRMAARDLGYRRFFDVNSLAALRVEDEAVFRATHARVEEWARRGWVDGLRIDHIDGLRDPMTYLARLRTLVPGVWIFVEKILGDGEALRGHWPVEGTTGYEFLRDCNALFVHPEGERPLTDFYATLTSETRSLREVIRDSKRNTVGELFGSDLNRLTGAFLNLCERNRCFRDYSRHEVHETLRELLSSFAVYRSYVRPGEPPLAEDGRVIAEAVARVKEQCPALDARLIDFAAVILRGEQPGPVEDDFASLFQQVTGPVMAKGVEDTAFYVWNRFVALNEVGGEPDRFGMTVEAFHKSVEGRTNRWPRSLLASTTHDTKRSEDVRARLALLSERHTVWVDFVQVARRLADPYRSAAGPDANTEYLYLQTLVGAWPLSPERAQAYLLKAAREAKVHTSWTRPEAAFEKALEVFVAGTLADPQFVKTVKEFVAPLVVPGRENSLAQVLLKLTSPGVPDIYQGSELWDLRLVDPDNRDVVDLTRRQAYLRQLETESVESLAARLADPEDEGLPKMWVIREALHVRRRQSAAFGGEGGYAPLTATGSRKDDVVAFMRGTSVVTVVARWPFRRAGVWGDTELTLPAGRWRNVLGGERWSEGTVELARLLAHFPVALLERDRE